MTKAPQPTAAETRRARLDAQLRENLKRRKEQTRARRDRAAKDADETPPTDRNEATR